MNPGGREPAPAARLPRAAVIAFLLVLPWLLFWYLLDPANGKVLGNDFLALPFRQEYHFALLLKQGYFPLWTPDSLGGIPAAHFLFAQPFFPPNAAKLLFAGYFEGAHLRLFIVQKLLLMSIASVFFHAFLRRRNFSSGVAALGAVLFLFNAPMLDALRYGTAFDAFALLPVLLYLVERSVPQGARGPSLLLIAPVLAAQVLAAYPQMLYYSLLLTNLYALHRLWPERWGERLAALLRLGAVELLGLAMAAVFLVPFRLDVMPYFRAVPSYASSIQFQTSLTNLLLSLSYPWFADVYGALYSSSLATLLLLVLGAAWLSGRTVSRPEERRERVFFAALLGVSLLLALGDNTLLHDLLWKYLPGFSALRAPARVLILAETAVAVLACHALRSLLRGDFERVRLRGLLLGVLLVVTLLSGLLVVLDTSAGGPGTLLRALLDRYVGKHSAYRLNGEAALNPKLLFQVAFYPTLFVLLFWLRRRLARPLFVGLLVVFSALEAGEYLKYGTWYRHYRDDSPRADYLANADYFYERRIPRWFEPGMLDPPPQASWELERGADPDLMEFLREAPPLLRATFFNDPSPDAPAYFPRAYWVPKARLSDRWSAEEMAASNPFNEVVVNVHDPANPSAAAVLDAAGVALARGDVPAANPDDPEVRRRFVAANRKLRVLDYTPNRAGFEIEPPAAGLLVYTDTFRPGWAAEVDGAPADVLRVNRAFKAVLVRAGSHRVEFEYVPRSFRVGLGVSLAACVGCIGLFGWQLAPRRRWLATLVALPLAALLAVVVQAHILAMARRPGLVGVQDRNLERLLKRDLR